MLNIHENTDILLISETHLDSDISDAAIRIPGYIVYRNDNSKGRKHGVCAYMSEKLHVENIDTSFLNVISFLISELNMLVFLLQHQ